MPKSQIIKLALLILVPLLFSCSEEPKGTANKSLSQDDTVELSGEQSFCSYVGASTAVAALSREGTYSPLNRRFYNLEMNSSERGYIPTRPKEPPDTLLMRGFKKEFGDKIRKGKSTRPVFEKYLPMVGADVLLDFLEYWYPICHSQAHELGQTIMANEGDIDTSIGICANRCTSACMHGVLKEAFGTQDVDIFSDTIVEYCRSSKLGKTYRPANCIHAIGHAFMLASGNDLEKAVSMCSSIGDLAMGYYCASGAYMEYISNEKSRYQTDLSDNGNLHYPCDQPTKYPTACYRYRIFTMLRAYKNDTKKVVRECLALPRSSRLGCFHGLGNTFISTVNFQPAILKEVCGYGNSDDQAICIEGVIESLARHSEAKALAACAYLDDKNAQVCRDAARGKTYRLDKPTMSLYTGG